MGDTGSGTEEGHVVRKLRFVALGGAIVVALGVAGCGGDSVPLSGSVRIGGSSTVAPLTRAMARRFMAEHPDVHISVATSGTRRGSGPPPAELPVVNDAVVLIVATGVPVRCLTTRQLAQIWHGNSEVTDSWSQIDDLRPAWDGNLNAWGPGTDTEEFAFFTKAVNHRQGETRDYNNVLHRRAFTISGVTDETGNLGYAEYGLYKRNANVVKALEVDSGNGCVAPAPQTIADGSFRPLSRRLSVSLSADALARPATKAFLRYYLDNVVTVAPQAGFVALTGKQLADSRARLTRLLSNAAR